MRNLINCLYVFLLIFFFLIFVFPYTAQCEETSGESPVAVNQTSQSVPSKADDAATPKDNYKEKTQQDQRSGPGVDARENMPSGPKGRLLRASPRTSSQETRIRSLEQGFNRSMRSINNSIRDTNTSIQRIRTLERRF
jgi:hypothetical protein